MEESRDLEAKPLEEISVENYMIPTKNPMVTIREEMEDDGKYVLFNADNELILVINQTGKFILDNSDGSKTIGEIIDVITDQFSIPENADIQSAVTDYFKRLSLAKLIVLNS
ncbi:MAG: PqqD family protein [Candidatus Omnitrophota bacterium]